MDSGGSPTIALFSIHPVYAKAILDGSKKVEFRKTGINLEVHTIVIYETAPVQKITGYFEIGNIEHGTPSQIWNEYQRVGGISRDKFRSYYSARKVAYAFEVKTACRIPIPQPLSVLNLTSPPQSYRYLEIGSIELLLDRSMNRHAA